MLNAVLFKSEKRFDSFLEIMKENDINCSVLDFKDQNWVDFDYSEIDILIYFPTFKFSSNHPLALNEVYDNLTFIKDHYPRIKMFPDPTIIKYYNDKYRQFLFLKKNDFPIPDTMPLLSDETVDQAIDKFGFPVVVKNRYGAGGESVFMINSKKELQKIYNLSRLNFYNVGGLQHFLKILFSRGFYYHLIKEREIEYPLFSYPLIAQRFIKMDRDLKTVVGDYKVVEGHWRIQADETMWKVNIDGGGIGEWSFIDNEAIQVSERLAKTLKTRWLNIDLVLSEGKYLITEFSPVWHHYKFKEKESFVYKDDYNIDMPLEQSLNLEKIILDSLINAAKEQ